MILDIVSIFLDLLPELILGAGPFCIFKGMGTGKDSGKLIFKKIYSDGGLTITENSTSLDLTSVGGGSSAIDTCEIAFGNGTGDGLISSTFKVSESDKTIYGLSCLGNANAGGPYKGHPYKNCSGVSGNKSSIVVGGYANFIECKSIKSVIAGGCLNKLRNYKDDSSTLLSQCSTVIIGGGKNTIKSSVFETDNSSIIGSYETCLNSKSSSLIGSKNSCITAEGVVSNGKQSRSFFNGCGSSINGNNYNTSVIGGKNNGVGISITTNSTKKITESLIIGSGLISANEAVFGGSGTGNSKSVTIIGSKSYISTSVNTSVIQGYSNCIINSEYSTILNGYKNCMDNLGYYSSINSFINYSSSILNGKYNCISFDPVYYRSNSNSIIVNGESNTIKGEDSNAILNGCFNSIINTGIKFPCNNTIVGGRYNSMCGSNVNSMVISGHNLNLIDTRNSIAFSSGKLGGDTTVLGDNNSIFQIVCGGFERFISMYLAGKNNSIMGVDGDTKIQKIFKNTCNSNILSLNDNSIITGTVSNSSIIGPSSIFYRTELNNLPRSLVTCNSVIVGQYGSLNNTYNSNILGGSLNRIEVANSSVIIGGHTNTIDGFTISDSNNCSDWCRSKNSVILGGHHHSLLRKGDEWGVIIGGSHSYSNGGQSLVPNLDSCDKFSAYSSSTGVKHDGISGSKSTLTSITVCNGILIAWAGT